MEITWIDEQDPVGHRIFDSWWEADEWADSILTDFYPFDRIQPLEVAAIYSWPGEP